MRLKNFSGAALIEFVCVLPFLILVLTGIVDYSLMLYDTSVIANAAREGARYGIVHGNPSYPTNASIISFTQTYCANNLISFSSKAPSATVTATASTSPPVSGSTLTVTITYAYTDLMIHYFMGTSGVDNLNATTVMVYE